MEEKRKLWDLYQELESEMKGKKIVSSEYKKDDGLYIHWDDGVVVKLKLKLEYIKQE